MKRILLLGFAVALICLGVYIFLATIAHPTFYGLARGAGGAIIWIALGGFLLWDDFLKPIARKGR